MKFIISLTFSLIISLTAVDVFAQLSSTQIPKILSLDSLRKREENEKDSIVYTAKHIRYTLSALLKDSIQTIPLDTALSNFQNYSPLNQPRNPTIGLGSVGLACRDLLFNPSKTIGFDVGFHSLDRYMLVVDSIRYYRAQSPYTELYYIDGGLKAELFRVTHAQNITPNWNIGGNYNRIGAKGFYLNQNTDHLNASFFTWFQSKNKRYMALATTIFNHIKAGENGSVTNDNVFTKGGAAQDALLETVRLSGEGVDMSKQTWKSQSYFLKQFYYLGKRDSVANKTSILPTQRISHMFNYSKNEYRFFRNEPDIYGAFPDPIGGISVTTTNDSTQVQKLSNELAYSFYLRGKSVNFLKNEVKLDVGIQHDWYIYQQQESEIDFNNITLKATLGYRFNDRAMINIDLQQIAQGKNAGDFLYDVKTRFLLGQSAGQITLGTYSQNKSPEQLFEHTNYQFHQWNLSLKKTKINNLSFLYENPKLKLAAKAEYFLISNYLYYQETTPRQITPAQLDPTINMLKLSLAKNFKVGHFHLDNYIVYQKSTYQDLLNTPELYTYNSFYYAYRLFKALLTNTGFDVRYNSLFKAPAYAINVGQFYNNAVPTAYDSFPVVDLFVKATLKRANLFLKYEFINQGMFQADGFYTVNKYPMYDGAFKMGISWKFYD